MGSTESNTRKTVLHPAEAEISVKKSRFICYLSHVESEEEALAFIESVKKKNYDARHNCSAYIISGNPLLERSSDNGEPSGTAGKPMMDILKGEGLENVCAVVTRYFGGILLGTGGLVRAYSDSLSEALRSADFAVYEDGYSLTVSTDYNGLGKLRYFASQNNIYVGDIEYTEAVSVPLIVPENMLDRLSSFLQDATAGKSAPENVKKVTYSDIDGIRSIV